ncbi:MAG TPA: phosphate ABC transporter substrate-binding protein PstS, partial [Candidatus Dormibacteraeota bacterium]|nr:phosphate ABC transporter substrate-binding protein PstS [Candidatus Dormibacteraeota bacterium]
ALAACGTSPSASPSPAATQDNGLGSASLTGAGSTFVDPLFEEAFYQYGVKYSSVSVNYQPVGSGAGITQFEAGTVDFGATDVPMTETDIAAHGGDASLVEIPDTLGVASIAYNEPSLPKFQIDGPTLAKIYLGTVKTWNDPAIAALNPGVTLPSDTIAVQHRSDSSGTTYAFTDYLAKVSADWKSGPGVSKAPAWPAGVGTGDTGNAGVGQAIKNTPGSIGYVELAYIVPNHLQQAWVMNANGKFVQGSQAGAAAAAAQATNVNPTTNFSITNEPGDASYPITTFSWVVVRTTQSDSGKGLALVSLIHWLVTDGQTYADSLQYAPLPAAVQTLALNDLKTVKDSTGKVLLPS